MHKLNDNMYLASKTLVSETPKPVAINHILVIDCSGSMAGELPAIREQLKNKLPKLLKEVDTVSIVWFSGRGQFGTLLTAEHVANLADLQTVNKLIDRWLSPIGMTGFREPLEEVSRLIEKIGKDKMYSLFFMSDGCENQWGRDTVIKAAEQAALHIAQATFVEYGLYADRPLLTTLAEKTGGTLIVAEDFDRYAPTFEAALRKGGVERVEVSIPGDTIGGFAFALTDGDLYTYGISDGKAYVPKGTTVYWLTPTSTESLADLTDPAPVYAALSLFSIRMNANVVWALLKYLGDVAFIDRFASCFGKQKYSEFQETTKQAAFDASLRLTQGKDCNRVPRDDAYTVLQLLEELSQDNQNHLLLEHPSFKYSRISRKRIDPILARKKELPSLIERETDLTNKAELQKELADLENYKPLKFDAQEAPEGYSVANLTYNEERPNISVLIRRTGTVNLSGQIPEGCSKVPEKFETFTFRNYSVIKDGLVNIDKLPVRVTPETWSVLAKEGLVSEDFAPEAILDLSKLPILNRKMVEEVSAKRLFELEYELTKMRAAQKVYGHFKKEHFPRKSVSFEILYGKESAAWLKEIGITDYSGFGPKGIQAESTDVYLGKELKISLKGFSSLPTVKDVRDRMAKGKLTPSAAIMATYVREVDTFLASEIYSKAADKNKLFEAWLDGQTADATRRVRELISAMARVKFAIVIAQIWPKEFASLDENTLTIEVDGQKIEAKLEMREVEIKI